MQFEILETPTWKPEIPILPDEEYEISEDDHWLPDWLRDNGTMTMMPNAHIRISIPLYPGSNTNT